MKVQHVAKYFFAQQTRGAHFGNVASLRPIHDAGRGLCRWRLKICFGILVRSKTYTLLLRMAYFLLFNKKQFLITVYHINWLV